jgi:hypothetical protein
VSTAWYFWYFATARGEAGLRANARGIAEVIWRRGSPSGLDDAMLDQAAEAFDNPDHVDIVIHSHRHRLATASRTSRLRAPKAPEPGDEPAMSITRTGGALTGPKHPPTWWSPVNRSPHSRRHREPLPLPDPPSRVTARSHR